MHPGEIDEPALLRAPEQGSIRAVSDYRMRSNVYAKPPLDRWYCMITSNTVTQAGATLMSDMVTQPLLNSLATGNDRL